MERYAFIHDQFLYAQGANLRDVEIDGFINYHWLASPAELGRPRVMLESGINGPAAVRKL